METSASTTEIKVSPAVTVFLIVLAVAVVALGLTGVSLPLMRTDKAAVIVLFAVGFMLCALGPASHVPKKGGWPSPIAIPGFVFGMAAIAVLLTVLTSIRLPMITDARSAFIALTVVLGIKMALATGYLIASRMRLLKPSEQQ